MPFAIPPILIIALGAVGAVAVGRWLAQEARRINAELHPDEDVVPTVAPAVTLRRDPASGIYRPE